MCVAEVRFELRPNGVLSSCFSAVLHTVSGRRLIHKGRKSAVIPRLLWIPGHVTTPRPGPCQLAFYLQYLVQGPAAARLPLNNDTEGCLGASVG